jgi:two-component system, LytTR family, response regulator
VYFQTDAGPHRPLILRSLNQLEGRLDAATFFRANRRQIINLDFVKRVEPADTGGLSLVLENDLIIDLSRRRATEFRTMSSL